MMLNILLLIDFRYAQIYSTDLIWVVLNVEGIFLETKTLFAKIRKK